MKAACVGFWEIWFGGCGYLLVGGAIYWWVGLFVGGWDYLYLYIVTEKVVYCLCSCRIVHPGDGGVCPTHECLGRAPTQAKPHVLVCRAAGIDDS